MKTLLQIIQEKCPVTTRDELLKIVADSIETRLEYVPIVSASEAQRAIEELEVSGELGFNFPEPHYGGERYYVASPGINPWLKTHPRVGHIKVINAIDNYLRREHPSGKFEVRKVKSSKASVMKPGRGNVHIYFLEPEAVETWVEERLTEMGTYTKYEFRCDW